MKTHGSCVIAVVLATLWLASTAQAEDTDLTEMVASLHEEGVIDEGQFAQMRDRAERRQADREWRDFLSFSGDFRARFEHFWRSRDSSEGRGHDRSRGRYRLRLGMKVDINDHLDLTLRLASGEEDSRSSNRSFGSGSDFDPDEISIDLAYLTLTPFPGAGLGEFENDMSFRVGKQPNPFRWHHGKDYMLWDPDLNPEGVAWRDVLRLNQGVELFANAGYFVLDENGPSRDPGLAAAQLGAHLDISDTLRFGSRGSYYNFGSLDSEFLGRGVKGTEPTASAGNLTGGLTDRAVNVVELGAYLRWTHFEQWPITVFGHWSRNLAAERVLSLGSKQDLAWMVGFELGDKEEWLLLGALYAAIEADAFPAQLIDSDLFDGVTNRRGGSIYAARRILERTDLNFALLFSDAIRDGAEFGDSVTDSDRVRLQADMVVTF